MTILRLLNLPPQIVELTRTSDGYFIGRVSGDVGFNAFLGRPSFHEGPGRDRMRETWRSLRFRQRREAVIEARRFGLSLRAMLGGGR